MRILLSRAWFLGLTFTMAVLAGGPAAMGAEERPAVLQDIGIDPVLGTRLPLDETFVDENGRDVALRTFFDGKQPVVLVLAYYGCPMLCGLVLNGVKDSLQKLDWLAGDHYKIVTISIDPKEDADLAFAKKKSVLSSASKPGFAAAGEKHWHFLVGKAGSEKRIASALGFRYKWVEAEKQWAHGAAMFIASPSGTLSRVLFGLDFPPRDLKLALLEAGEGKVGTIAEKLLLFCYHYDPKDNKYALLASRLVTIGGALTVSALLLAYLVWFLRSRRKGNACSLSP